MKKKISIILLVVSVVVLIMGLVIVFIPDNIKFKLFYEYLNKIEYSNGKTIKVNIPITNPIKYLDMDEVEDIFTSGTGIVYFGYNSCPWCRNVIPVLISAAKENSVNRIYYVDTHSKNIESSKLVAILNEYLRVDDEGNKRLAVPDVYFIKDGKVLAHHIGTVESYTNPYLGMSREQIEELKNIYTSYIKEMK